jgi:hypothetical protein
LRPESGPTALFTPGPTEIIAALLWDVPALRALGAPGGREFSLAFSSSAQAAHARPENDAPLLLAAHGVLADRQGDTKQALSLYERIGGDPWRDLLRLCLRAWSASVVGIEDIVLAGDLVSTLPVPSAEHAHLAAKLATFAYDKSAGELFERFLREAVDAAPEGSRLAAAVRVEAINLLGDRHDVPASLGNLPSDPLVALPWITETAHTAAERHLADLVRDRARGPWSSSLRIGRGPLDDAVAAELQATWCGALWHRRELRRQLGAQLLLNDPRDSDQARHGAWAWILGGGPDERAVLELVEPVLTRAGVAWLINAFASRLGRRDVVDQTLAEVALVLWDCLPEELIPALMDRLPPGPSDDLHSRSARRLWAYLAVRLPEGWTERFMALAPETQLALLEFLTPDMLRALGREVATRLLEILKQGTGLPRSDALLAEVVLRDMLEAEPEVRVGAQGKSEPLNTADVSPSAAIDLAREAPFRVASLPKALSDLADAVRRQRRDAAAGQLSIGVGSTAQQLAIGLVLPDAPLPSETEEHVSALWDSALDEGLVASLRLEALAGLGRLAAHDRLVPDLTAELRSAHMKPTLDSSLGGEPDEAVLRAARLLVLVPTFAADDEIELLALSRANDARAREIAINAAGLVLERRPSERLDQVLLTALYDPEEGVICRAVSVLELHELALPAIQTLLHDRLLKLLTTRRRRVRIAIARLAVQEVARGRRGEVLDHVLQLALEDKCWRVRQAVAAR